MKPILLFGAAGASEAIEDLTKAQVRGYTRADGTYVKPYTTKKPAAKQKAKSAKKPASKKQTGTANDYGVMQFFAPGGSGSGRILVSLSEKTGEPRVWSENSSGVSQSLSNHMFNIDAGFEEKARRLRDAVSVAYMESEGDPEVVANTIRRVTRFDKWGVEKHEKPKEMKKAVLLFGDGISDLVKAQVRGYTRSDGTYVNPYTTKRQAAAAKPSGSKSKGSGPSASGSSPAVRSNNEGYGFFGTAYHSYRRDTYGDDNYVPDGKQKEANDAVAREFSRVANELISAGHFDSPDQARDFLDSAYGRHLANEIGHKGSIRGVKWLDRSVRKFKLSEGKTGG